MSSRRPDFRADIMRARVALDALPDRAVIIDKHGDAWQKSAFLDTWYRAFDGNGEPPSTLAQNVGTVVAVHEPDDRCLRCGGVGGAHGKVHVRHGNGGGHNEPCPLAQEPRGWG